MANYCIIIIIIGQLLNFIPRKNIEKCKEQKDVVCFEIYENIDANMNEYFCNNY